jgi:PKD repeat protein
MYTLQFIDESLGNPGSWDWDFGDGTTSADQNPVHTFSEDGEYLVSLTISNDSIDCTSTIEMPVFVGDSIWFPDSCVAMFYAYPDDQDYFTFNFIDMSIGNGNSPPDNWSWSFGDGTGSDEQNPVHTFADEGLFEVCLTISTDDGECENTWCEYIEVIDWDTYCEAQFFYYPANDTFPISTLQFVDISLGNPTSWDWDFGDGSTSDEQNPVHTYASDGFYEVCLSIANPIDSCESTFCQEVYVYNDSIWDCWAWFEYEINDLTVDFEAYLNNSQEGEYTWDFGDGETGTGPIISHTYTADGIYIVSLTVVDSVTGCFTSYTDYLWIGDNITFNIDGNIYLADSAFADLGTVYLMTFDTIGNGLINIAETDMGADGFYEFEEVGIENCMYFVQAELSENSAYYGDYLPTYHISALNWMEAMPVFPFFFDYPADIYMIASEDSNETGDGMISGTVTNEDGRSVVENVEILLLDANSNPLTYIMTDADGLFGFPQLAYGTYIVHTEIVGVETIPVTITLDAENPNANINIVVRNGEALLGIDQPQSLVLGGIEPVYPNPTNSNAAVTVYMKQEASLNISISNNYGQQLMNEIRQLGIGVQQIKLNTKHLPKGLYFINLTTNEGIVHVQKLVKL